MTGPMARWCALARPGRLGVVSPHFDDAVLGCGQLLAAHPGALVVTVAGGDRPGGWERLTAWDGLAGFVAGEDVVARRRAEDAAALAELGARGRWLTVPDHQYVAAGQDRPAPAQVAAELAGALGLAHDDQPDTVLVPLGLANPDHVLTHEACRLLLAEHRGLAWWGYAEAGYAHIPGLLTWRLGELAAAGWTATPVAVPLEGGGPAKRRAVACYASQLRALRAEWGYDPDRAPAVPESYWRLDPAPVTPEPG